MKYKLSDELRPSVELIRDEASILLSGALGSEDEAIERIGRITDLADAVADGLTVSDVEGKSVKKAAKKPSKG